MSEMGAGANEMRAVSNNMPCPPHNFGWRMVGGVPGHEHSHPTGPQVCLACGKSFDDLIGAAVAEEREACAKVAEADLERSTQRCEASLRGDFGISEATATRIAAAIRAR